MGFLSSAGKALGGGIAGIGSFSSIGNMLNDITGATSSAKRAQQYTLEQMAKNHEYQKEFAQNAHQWEVQDLEAAGLNPILSAGAGAAASGGGIGSGASNQSNIGITDIANSAITAMQTLSNVDLQKAQENQANSQANKNDIEAGMVNPRAKAEIENMTSQSAKNKAEIGLIESQKALNSAKKAEARANTKFQNERARGKSISLNASGGNKLIKGNVGGSITY